MQTEETKREVKELSLLFEVQQALSKSLDLREVVIPVLHTMSEHMGLLRGTLSILNRESGEIIIEEAYGLSLQEQSRGRYRIGEGIIGTVVESGEPLVIPNIGKEPRFLNRTKSRRSGDGEEVSFLCVPIKLGTEVVGTLSADRIYTSDNSLDYDLRLLSIIAGLIAQAVKIRQESQERVVDLENENMRLQDELRSKFQPSNIVGNTNNIKDVYILVERVSRSNATVLIRGESGVGKELVANAIHYNSHRANMPFIKVHCAALSESIIESELFGHERGAFTGATGTKKGRFELADGGTIFLDEIGDISVQTQIKLLRVLQEKEFERVGGNKTIKIDVRVIAATNRNLEQLIAEGKFRQDLYYRINVFPIHVPPLRERRSDILLLAEHFVEKYSKANHKLIRRISTPAIDMLMSYHWPGNVRELENCMERAVILSNDGVIHGYNLPPTLQIPESPGTGSKSTLKDKLDVIEKEIIIDALKSTRGNMSKAASVLGMTDRIMGLRIKKFDLNSKDFK